MILDEKNYFEEKDKTVISLGIDPEKGAELFAALEYSFTLYRAADEDDVIAKLGSSLGSTAAVVFEAKLIGSESFGLMKRVEDDTRFIEIPLIAAATDGDSEFRGTCIRAGVNEFLESPFNKDVIPLRIKNAARAKDAVTFHEMELMLRELPSNIYFKDSQGRYIFSSHYWHHLNSGGSAGWTIRGKTDFDIQKDQSIAQKAYDSDMKIISSGKGASYILELRDGDILEFLQVIKSPLYDGAGNVNGIIAIMNDVTELELLKRKLEDRTERIDAELSVASQIQMNMLPMDFVGHDRIAISSSMTPAKNVGGDFYDCFFIDDDHVGLVMADVSGKGIPAALGMTISKIVLHDCALVGGTPAEIMTDANKRICQNNKMQLFITVWFGILDLNTGTIQCTNAGHEYPAVKAGDEEWRLIYSDNFPPIGTMDDIEYENDTIELGEKGCLFLYTDGVTDLKNPEGKRFGIDRAMAALSICDEDDPDVVISGMSSVIEEFIGDADRFDDTTMMFVHYDRHGKSGS